MKLFINNKNTKYVDLNKEGMKTLDLKFKCSIFIGLIVSSQALKKKERKKKRGYRPRFARITY